MAVKILALVSLIFYFLALVFGLMLFFNSDQRDLITSGEAYGYSTIDLPNIDNLQGLMNQEAEIINQDTTKERNIVLLSKDE